MSLKQANFQRETSFSRPQNGRKRNQNQKDQISYYELLEMEKQKNETDVKVKIKRNFPIAPDGFIPNSVVRKFFKLLEPGPLPEKKVWKLKWNQPSQDEDNLSDIVSEVNDTEDFHLGLTSDEEEAAKVENEQKAQVEQSTVNRVEPDENRDLKFKKKRPVNLINLHDFKSVDDTDKPLKEFIKRLKVFDWFKPPGDLNIENITRYLMNKLIERDSNKHATIANFIHEIKKKFKLSHDLILWIRGQLEEELDATDPEIINNTLKLIAEFCVETYNIDSGLINILSQSAYQAPTKALASEILRNLTDCDEKQVDLVIKNKKKLQNPRLKRIETFKLKKFAEEIEQEIKAALAKQNEVLNVDDQTNSEIFKQILKEDWIPEATKAELKTLKDFLNYILKSLKTVKSKIFYEKLCNYLKALYDEFKLVNSNWEKQIIDSLVNSNADSKVLEQIRVIDIDNLGKYHTAVQEQTLKHEILSELLRSAAFEKTRPIAQENSKKILKNISNLSEADLDALVKFCETKNFKLSWNEALNFYKARPDITLDEFKELKGPSVVTLINDNESVTGSVKAKKKKEKEKEKEKDKDKDKTKDKDGKTNKKNDKADDKKKDKQKAKPETIKEAAEPDDKTKKNQNAKGVSNLLPNNSKGWDYYQKRNEREKEKENEKTNLGDENQPVENQNESNQVEKQDDVPKEAKKKHKSKKNKENDQEEHEETVVVDENGVEQVVKKKRKGKPKHKDDDHEEHEETVVIDENGVEQVIKKKRKNKLKNRDEDPEEHEEVVVVDENGVEQIVKKKRKNKPKHKDDDHEEHEETVVIDENGVEQVIKKKRKNKPKNRDEDREEHEEVVVVDENGVEQVVKKKRKGKPKHRDEDPEEHEEVVVVDENGVEQVIKKKRRSKPKHRDEDQEEEEVVMVDENGEVIQKRNKKKKNKSKIKENYEENEHLEDDTLVDESENIKPKKKKSKTKIQKEIEYGENLDESVTLENEQYQKIIKKKKKVINKPKENIEGIENDQNVEVEEEYYGHEQEVYEDNQSVFEYYTDEDYNENNDQLVDDQTNEPQIINKKKKIHKPQNNEEFEPKQEDGETQIIKKKYKKKAKINYNENDLVDNNNEETRTFIKKKNPKAKVKSNEQENEIEAEDNRQTEIIRKKIYKPKPKIKKDYQDGQNEEHNQNENDDDDDDEEEEEIVIVKKKYKPIPNVRQDVKENFDNGEDEVKFVRKKIFRPKPKVDLDDVEYEAEEYMDNNPDDPDKMVIKKKYKPRIKRNEEMADDEQNDQSQLFLRKK